MTTITIYLLFIGVICVERLVELTLTKRHARALFARGGVEFGASHYPWMVALHTLFLLGCALEPLLARRPFIPMLAFVMLAVALAAQGIRWWAITTLGVHWNTRVIVVPKAPRITTGPYRYRWLRHPNYIAVVMEGIALPLVHSAWVTSLVFTILNACLLLMVRIRIENSALDLMTTEAADQRSRRAPEFRPPSSFVGEEE